MFPSFLIPEQDFEHQLSACVSAMSELDVVGQTLVFERDRGTLHIHPIDMQDLVDIDIERYEMVVFDGGSLSGDRWKHVFFPRQQTHCFVQGA